MNFIKQQDPRGCCVACVAMLTGLSYERVWRDQTKAFSPEEVLNFNPLTWSVYLSWLGFEFGFFYAEGLLLDLQVEFPLGVRYFCSVGLHENHPRSGLTNGHAIVLDEFGIVFDPLNDAPGVMPMEHYRVLPSKLLSVGSVLDRRLG
jgi:hypothetical protein